MRTTTDEVNNRNRIRFSRALGVLISPLLASLLLIGLTAPIHATPVPPPAPAAEAAPVESSATVSDTGGGMFGWRCKNDGDGNTLYAIGWQARQAPGVGCETDVQMDAEGKWWVFHDPHLGEVTRATKPTGKHRLGDLTTAEASRLRYWEGRQLKVASADQFFQRAAEKGVELMVEVKRYPHGVTQSDINRLAAIGDRSGASIRWEVFGGKIFGDRIRQDHRGGYVITMLREAGQQWVGAKAYPSDPNELRDLGATFVSLHPDKVTDWRVHTRYASRGIAVRSKIAHSSHWDRLYEVLGRAAWMTNDPAALSQWYRNERPQ